MRGEFARKERQGTARPLMFVMLDELNKYAPREGDSPIKQILLDIAERGRSLGVILIGAQQTASEVERRIVANCAIRVAGRLDAAEAERPEYGYLPPAQRQRATLAKPGTMFIAQPDIPVPLAVDFPFPAWATRPSEKGEWAGHDAGPARPADPFAAIARPRDEPAAVLGARGVPMKILHTSDWHVGKVLKGRDRHDEHAAALGSIVRTARDEDVDMVLIAGDLFETAAPNARAQGLVMRTLLALREDGRQVVAIAGNHDNQNLLDAVYRPVLGELGLHVLGLPKRPGQGGTVALRTRGGETVNVAALPFLSHRYAVRAAEVLLHDFAEHTLDYARQVAAMVALLTEGFTGDAVNLVMAHATLLGGRRGGGERDVQTSLGYELPASMFPPTAHYVALGHLHRCQEIPGPCPIFYSGSPLAVDFGEQDNDPSVLIVTAAPGVRADARAVPVTGGRPLRTLRGTLDHVIAEGEQAGDAYLRVILAEPGRAGLGDLVRERLPNTLEVMLDDAHRPRPGSRSGDRASRVGRSPQRAVRRLPGRAEHRRPAADRDVRRAARRSDQRPRSGLAAMTGEA